MKTMEYVVEAGYGTGWISMRRYDSLELAIIDKEEIAIEEDTQTRIKVYEVEYFDKLENLLTRTKEVKSRQIVEIL